MFSKIKQLFGDLAIYGLGDVLTSLVGFLLLPLFTEYLTPSDYGVIGLLLTTEVAVKIISRWGVDASFMRLYYDCPDQRAKQSLASTLFFFLLGVNGLLLAAALLYSRPLAVHLFDTEAYVLPLRLVLINTVVAGFFFIPFHELRIQKRPRTFTTLSLSRSLLTTVLRIVFIAGLQMGVLGFVLADTVALAVFVLVLLPKFAALIRPVCSWPVLRDALGFGLPRVPHGVAHQMISSADRYWLSMFVAKSEIGLYSVGAGLGMALKLFLSAFEFAWAPFYFAEMKRPDAAATFSRVTTYVFTGLVLLTAGMSAIGDDLVRLMTAPEFHAAARFIPWIAIGVTLQGIYLLTSIGLNITKQTQFYPLATGLAAATSVAANLLLIPRVGTIGAAWANVLAYGVLAAVSFAFSRRLYPIAYEWRRLVHALAAGVVSYAAAVFILPIFIVPIFIVPIFAVPDGLPPWLGVLVRGTIVVVTYVLLLISTGFLYPPERAALWSRLRLRAGAGLRPAPTETNGLKPSSTETTIETPAPPVTRSGVR